MKAAIRLRPRTGSLPPQASAGPTRTPPRPLPRAMPRPALPPDWRPANPSPLLHVVLFGLGAALLLLIAALLVAAL